MKKRNIFCALAAAVLLLPATANAQIGVRSKVIIESYSFDAGLSLKDVTEITVPIGIDIDLGRRASLALSTGYVTVDLTSAVPAQLSDQSISTLVDTEFRLNYDVIPGKLVLIVNGALPTGSQTVRRDELSILGAISSDVIGFASPTVGTGGNIGGGFAGAIPLGRNFAIGVGGTIKSPLAYKPISSDTSELTPGAEMRFRVGLQGSLARRTYVRFAGIFASRGNDDFGNLTQNGVGDRVIGYGSLNQALGSGSVTLYGFIVNRGDPNISSPTAAILPRGRLTAFGARLDLRMSRTMTLSPRAEIRSSKQAPDETTTTLQEIGSSTRFGTDLSIRMGRTSTLILQGSYLTGDLVQSGSEIGFNGGRFSVEFDWNP